MSLFFYLFTFAINLCRRQFVTADVTAVFVNSQYDTIRYDALYLRVPKSWQSQLTLPHGTKQK